MTLSGSGICDRPRVCNVGYDANPLWCFATCSDDLIVTFVPDQYDPITLCRKFSHLTVDLVHQGTGCIDDNFDLLLFGFLPHRWRDAVRAQDQFGTSRHFINGLHKTHAASGKILDHVLVVNDFMKHVNRCAVSLKCSFHSLDGHLHACTVAARLCYDDFAYYHKYASSLVD